MTFPKPNLDQLLMFPAVVGQFTAGLLGWNFWVAFLVSGVYMVAFFFQPLVDMEVTPIRAVFSILSWMALLYGIGVVTPTVAVFVVKFVIYIIANW
jgi:hypothetical protein